MTLKMIISFNNLKNAEKLDMVIKKEKKKSTPVGVLFLHFVPSVLSEYGWYVDSVVGVESFRRYEC